MPTVVWKGNPALFTAGVNTVLVEQPESPAYEFSKDGPKCTRTFRGLHSLCLDSGLAPGTVGTGDMSGWLVTKCTVKRLPRQIGELVIEYGATAAGGAGGLAVLPADDFDLSHFEVNPRVEAHPKFADFDAEMFTEVRTAADSPSSPERDRFYSALTPEQKYLVDLINRGVNAYYLAGIVYTWTVSMWAQPTDISVGGYIETPSGPLSSLLSGVPDFSWLRQCDELRFNGNFYQFTRSWMGGPSGHWDPFLYS